VNERFGGEISFLGGKGNSDVMAPHVTPELPRCRAHDETDALDLELARRLNEFSAGAEQKADHLRPLAPTIAKLLCWALAASAGAGTALWWVT
jgi:hypothetical protein